ncbi:MAG: NUDIX domain-containing protein [Alphaproteobacteria bacterium]|nr:NUDIX domain-containing protein [Alphaproteobacteria bacterium]
MSDDVSDRVRIKETRILSDDYYVLRRLTFDFLRGDGTWQTQTRESYDIGNAATVLPHDKARDKVILIQQFRLPVHEWGYRQLLVEAIAGKLDGDTPTDCVIKESMEEAGVTITNPRLISHCFASPGAVKERVSLFLADYDSTAPRPAGGGEESEGEDIIVLEMSLDAALGMIASGEIVDLKTIALLQAAKLAG